MRKYVLAHPWLLAFAILSGFAMKGLTVYAELLTRDIVDALVTADGAALFSYVGIVVVVIFLVWLFMSVSMRVCFLYEAKADRTLKYTFFERILNKKMSDFNKENSAKYISVFNNDMGVITDKYFSVIPQVIESLFGLLLAIVAIAIISPVNAVITVVTASFPLIAPLVYAKKLARTNLDVSTRSILFNQRTKDYLSGFEVIKTFGIANKIKSRFFNVLNGVAKAEYGAGAAATDVGALSLTIMMAIGFLNYFVAGYFVIRGDVTVGGVIAIFMLSGTVANPMGAIAGHIGSFKSVKTIVKRVLGMMEQEDTAIRPAVVNTLEGGITFKNVDFAYEVATDEDAADDEQVTAPPLAVKNLSYTFKKNGKYAIVGASGSGKSTIVKLMMGYYDNYSGDMLLNGHNIRDINREGLYKVVSTLQQNVFLLDDTLKNNVTLYNEYSDEEYRAVLERAKLLDVEANLANGSDTVLGEGGNTISGGERQRISIARALLKGSEVMLLDEATASLDNIIAHDIEKSIVGIENLTCIFVTHRYNKEILQKFDGILVMRNGELVEQGIFDELYSNKEYFFSLYTAFGEYGGITA